MKKLLLLLSVSVLVFMGGKINAEIDCPEGQIATEVLVSEEVPAVPSYTECVKVGLFAGDYADANCTTKKGIGKHWKKVVYPEIPAVPAVYEWQCVADPDYVEPSDPQEPIDEEPIEDDEPIEDEEPTQPEEPKQEVKPVASSGTGIGGERRMCQTATSWVVCDLMPAVGSPNWIEAQIADIKTKIEALGKQIALFLGR